MRISALIAVATCVLFNYHNTTAKWSWREKPVEITATGDFKWKPQPFQYQPGNSIRYIDFNNGDDTKNGTSPSNAWKHHPWDPAATGNAKNASGIHTYVFKRGVIYRGELIADESGTPQMPIQLTSSPEYGSGDAMIYGSEPVTSGWQQGGHSDIPQSNNVWHIDLPYAPRGIWLVEGNSITRIELARTPNWKVSNPDDVKSEWWAWNFVASQIKGDAHGRDRSHLTESSDYYVGAAICYEWGVVMGTPYTDRVKSFNESSKTLTFKNSAFGITNAGPKVGSKYFLEDKPHYLDSDGEYWFDKTGDGGRLFIRLPGGKNPNQAHVEVAKRANCITLDNQSNIGISGLTFRFNNPYWDITANLSPGVEKVKPAAIKKEQGSGANISVTNCLFEHVTQAVRFETHVGNEEDVIVFSDNDVHHTKHAAVEFFRRGHVKLLRNNFHDIYFRSFTGGNGFGVTVNKADFAEVAGNIVHRAYGAGIYVTCGQDDLIRVLIHHNKVTDALLSACDWGAIETTSGGPNYVFNNIVGNPNGYRHYDRGKSLAYGYYFDGTASKNYLFNNIAWGKSNSNAENRIKNYCALMQVWGMENNYFNNTIYNFRKASHRQGVIAQRNIYVGNLFMDLSEWGLSHAKSDKLQMPNEEHVGDYDSAYDYPTAGYSRNIFYDLPEYVACFNAEGNYYNNLEAFNDALKAYKVLAYDAGSKVNSDPVRNASAHDFRLKEGSSAINKGGKVFVPWRLYKAIGEYHFRRNNNDPTRIIDNHWYMATYYGDRKTHSYMPKYPLKGINISATDYVDGDLEDWTASALLFDGVNKYAKLTDTDIHKDVTYPDKNGREGRVPGYRKVTAEMDDNNFLLEVYLQVARNHKGGLIIGKADAKGYILEIDQAGKVRLRLRSGGVDVAKRSSAVAIDDGKWHHVIAEVDRSVAQGIRIYIDGKASNGAYEGTMPTGSLANDADVLVGGGPGQTYLAGALDFLRISRGTLADAETTIEELYAWQFDGPQFYDFMGNEIKDGRRDAGAFEGESTYVPVAVNEQPYTIGKATRQVVSTLKAAAESGMDAGIKTLSEIENTEHLLHADSVEILLADNDREQNVSGAFSVPSTGLYQFSITSSAQVKFELQERKGNYKTDVIVPATTKNTLQIKLFEGRAYTYTLITPIQNASSECKIKWTALER